MSPIYNTIYSVSLFIVLGGLLWWTGRRERTARRRKATGVNFSVFLRRRRIGRVPEVPAVIARSVS